MGNTPGDDILGAYGKDYSFIFRSARDRTCIDIRALSAKGMLISDMSRKLIDDDDLSLKPVEIKHQKHCIDTAESRLIHRI